MTEISKTVCDNCERVLNSFSSYPAEFALRLNTLNVNTNTTGMVYAIHMEPAFKGDKHFCNNKCLKEWIDKNEDPDRVKNILTNELREAGNK